MSKNHYTLFVDESGDFSTNKGQWILSGVLCNNTKDYANKAIANRMNPLYSRYGIQKRKNFHLTELRTQYDHVTANKIAGEFFDGVLQIDHLSLDFFIVKNINKKQVIEKEQTYRFMLMELIALADSVVSQITSIDTLNVVIATRTNENRILMTTQSDIKEQVLSNLKESTVYGLASRGLFSLIEENRFNYDLLPASQNEGLILADFLANLTYNDKHKESREVLKLLQEKNKYHVFDSYGSTLIRKYRILKRDKDYSSAMYYLLQIDLSAMKKYQLDQKTELSSLILDILKNTGVRGILPNIELLIEKLWQRFQEPESQPELLNIIYTLIESWEDLSQLPDYKTLSFMKAILFRLRNFAISLLNHQGNVIKVRELSKQQEEIIPSIANNPEYIPFILELFTLEKENSINELNGDGFLRLSKHFEKYIKDISETTTIIFDIPENNIAFSRYNTLSIADNLRGELYFSDIPNNFLKIYDTIEENDIHPKDLRRLQQYKLFYLNKSNDFNDALILCRDLMKKSPSIFDHYWILRTISNSLLFDFGAYSESIQRDFSDIVDFDFEQNAYGHPYELIYRELALIHHLLDKSKEVIKTLLRKSEKAVGKLHESALIQVWLKDLFDVHKDFISNGSLSAKLELYFKKFGKTKPDHQYLIRIRNINEKNDRLKLLRLRNISPY